MALNYIVNHDTLKTNLNCYFPLNEVSGSRYDAVNGFALTDNNTVGSTTGTVNNRAANFVRANSESLSTTDTSTDITSDFSFSVWVKFTSLTSGQLRPFFGKDGGASTRSYASWFYNNSGTHSLRMFISGAGTIGSSEELVVNISTLSTGTWYHIVGTWDASASTAEFFIDGSSVGTATGTQTAIANTSATWYLGRFGNYSGDYTDAVQEDFGLWSKILSGDEITDLNNSGEGMTYGVDWDKGKEEKTSGVSSQTVTLKAEGVDRMAVLYAVSLGGDDVTGITVDGVSADFVWKKQIAATSQYMYCYMFASPPASSVNYVVTRSGSTSWLELHVQLYTGVNQSTTPDSSATGSGGNTTWTISTTTVADYAFLSSAGRNVDYGQAITPGTNTVTRSSNELTFRSGGSRIAQGTAGSKSNVWIDGGGFGDTYGGIISLAPVSAVAGPSIKTINGIAKASISSWNGVTLA